MAFGDKKTEDTGITDHAATVTATCTGYSPAATDLMVGTYFTGAANGAADTTGFASAVSVFLSATATDDGHIFWKVGTDTELVCSDDSGSMEEQVLVAAIFEGPFKTAPIDLTDTGVKETSDPFTTGTAVGNTAQASELMIAIGVYRHGTNNSQVTFTQTGDVGGTVSSLTTTEGLGSYKHVVFGFQVLTGVGTVGLTLPNSNNNTGRIGFATFMEDAGGGGGGSTHHIHLPLLGVG